jgi:HEPN domain-containing protein
MISPPNAASSPAATPVHALRSSIERIIAALRARIIEYLRAPAVPEIDFLNLTGNHGQLCAILRDLGHHSAAREIRKNALFIGYSWMRLAQEHLEDANMALPTRKRRTVYSRSYYAAYNASKAVRYVVYGAVSRLGDDHKQASDLPDDFPHINKWAEAIPKLREHRLLSDYDNWRSTDSGFTLTLEEAVNLASEFIDDAQSYLKDKVGGWL